MILHLVNDLPLLAGVPADAASERKIARAVHDMGRQAPAHVAYVPFPAVERWWREATDAPCHYVLIGTRPAALHQRRQATRDQAAVTFVAPRRSFDTAGRTVEADLPQDLRAPAAAIGRTVRLIDDVLMSGHTLACAIRAVSRSFRPGRLHARVMIANRHSLDRLSALHPQAEIQADVMPCYEPITQGTVIFLYDLLYGTLLGRPFLEQTALLRPYFGVDMRDLRKLRDIAQVLAHGPGSTP
jgi:hypothetical protein